MILSRKCRNVHIIDCERTQEFLLISDLHWDNPKCDRELLKSHLDDTNDIKNYGNYQWLKTAGHPILWEEPSWRNGCAIFRK